jgi:hypothetical protein
VTPVIVWHCPRILIRVSCSRYVRPRTSYPSIRVCGLNPRLLRKAEHASCDQTRSHQGYNLHFHSSLPFYTQAYVFVNTMATRLLARSKRILWLPRSKNACLVLQTGRKAHRRHSRSSWFLTDVFGLSSNNVGPFSRNVVPSGSLFSINLVPKQRCFWAEPFMLNEAATRSP